MVNLKQITATGAIPYSTITYNGTNWTTFDCVKYEHITNVLTATFAGNSDSIILLDAPNNNIIQTSNQILLPANDILIKAGDSTGDAGGNVRLSSGVGLTNDGYLSFEVGEVELIRFTNNNISDSRILFDADHTPYLRHSTRDSGSGLDFYIQAQNTTDIGQNGGDLILSSGGGGIGGDDGFIYLMFGQTNTLCSLNMDDTGKGFLIFDEAVNNIDIYQDINIIDHGHDMTIAAQTSTANPGNGGDIYIKGGNSTHSTGGNVYLVSGDGYGLDGYGQIISTNSALTNGANIIPIIDNTGYLGTGLKRWHRVYTNKVISGDFCFTDKICIICKQPFNTNDNIIYKIHEQEKEYQNTISNTIPIHLSCAIKGI